MDPSRTPVIVGAAQVVANRSGRVEAAREPLALVLDALAAAADPAVLALADTVCAVGISSWDYDELSRQVASALGTAARHRVDSDVGGHWPLRLLEQVAQRIAHGDSQVAVVVGGEAAASTAALHRAGVDPVADLGWRPRAVPAPFDAAAFGGPEQVAAGLLLPTRAYPLFENRLQADLGQTPQQAARWSAELYAALSDVAAHNPAAWSPRRRSAEDIATVTSDNRLICEPYPLAVNAHPRTDQAAALVVTSLGFARARGIPDEQLTYVWGGAGVDDPVDLLRREAYGSSAALLACLTRTTALAPAAPDVVDVYSCFPVVPKLASIALGLPPDAVLSATGGHSSFGGPLSSYALHAVVAVRERLRSGAGTVGMVHANGGYLTYQHALLLGSRPHPDGYVGDPVPDRLRPTGVVAPVADGDLLVETATVERDRAGGAAGAYVLGRTPDGRRAVATTSEPAVAEQLSLDRLGPGVSTHVGRRVRVRAVNGVAVLTDVL